MQGVEHVVQFDIRAESYHFLYLIELHILKIERICLRYNNMNIVFAKVESYSILGYQ